MRVPAVDPKRDNLIRHFEKKLAYFRGIPAHRREDEAADEGEATCRAMISELRGERPTTTGMAQTMDEWLDGIEQGLDDDKG
jgi:hypothetical protein